MQYTVYIINDGSFFVPQRREHNIDRMLQTYGIEYTEKFRVEDSSLAATIGADADIEIFMINDYSNANYTQEMEEIEEDTYEAHNPSLTIYIPNGVKNPDVNMDNVNIIYQELICNNIVNEFLNYGLSIKQQLTTIRLMMENKESI